MTGKDEIVIDVKINSEEVATKLAAATKAVAEHKKQQKELKKAMEESNGTNAIAAKMYAEVTAQIEKENREIKSSTALLQAEAMSRLDDNASLDEQRQLLNAAQKAYAQLSGEEKIAADAAGGLRDQIEKLSDRVKEQESALGDTRRNVGNYAMQTAEAAGKMGFFGKGVTNVINPLKNMTAGLKAASATPLVAVLSLAITILTKLAERFKTNSAAMEKLTKVFGIFSGAGEAVNWIIDKIADGLGWLADKALELADKLGLLTDQMKEGQAIALEDLAIQKEQQQVALQNAQSQNKIAKLRADAANKDKYTAKERLALLQQAADEEEAISQRQYDLAKREYELQKRKNEQSASSQEDLKKENDLRIAMINAETALFEKQKSLNTQMATLREQESKGLDLDVENAKKNADALAAIRTELVRRTRTELENEIADLEQKRDEELAIVGLTKEERLAIEDYYADQIKQRRDAEANDVMQAELDKLQARKDAREQFGLDPEKTPEEQELELLQKAREQDLLNAEEYEAAKTLITEKYSKMRADDIAKEVKEATKLYQQEMKTAASSAAGAMNALSDLVGEFAEGSEAAAKAQKAFALGSILINEAMSIAEGAKAIAAAMAGAAEAAAATGPAAPIMLAVYQAQMIGQVLAIVASVASTIVQAKQVFSQANDAGKFEQGGIVGGTSYTGDQITARVNSREMILPLDAQKRLFDAITGNGDGTLGMNYEMLAAALAALPAPVLDYSEFTDFQNNVATYNEIAAV